jgi:hypothetical protein
VTVDGRVFGDERVDVRDADEQAEAARLALGVLHLVEVARLAVVDGRPEQPAQVAHALDGRHRRGPARVPRLFNLARDLRGEVRLEARVGDGRARDGAQVWCVSFAHTLLRRRARRRIHME